MAKKRKEERLCMLENISDKDFWYLAIPHFVFWGINIAFVILMFTTIK
jgi:hypothetical protein